MTIWRIYPRTSNIGTHDIGASADVAIKRHVPNLTGLDVPAGISLDPAHLGTGHRVAAIVTEITVLASNLSVLAARRTEIGRSFPHYKLARICISFRRKKWPSSHSDGTVELVAVQ